MVKLMKQKQFVPMIATAGMYYGRELKAGDHFDADPEHLPLLTMVARPRDEKDDEMSPPITKHQQQQPKYKRRDLRPER
jgi:hypothetical protein